MPGAAQGELKMEKSKLESRCESLLDFIELNARLNAEIEPGRAENYYWQQATSKLIGGPKLDDCLEIIGRIKAMGFGVTLDYLGECAADLVTAADSTVEILRVLRAIEREDPKPSIILDLLPVGLLVDEVVCFENAVLLVQEAQDAGLQIVIDTSGEEHVETILEIHKQLCYHFNNVGITLQAHLPRTVNDLAATLSLPGPIRLVNGKYRGLHTNVCANSAANNVAFSSLMQTLLLNQHSCVIASHDAILLHEAHTFIAEQKLATTSIAFEMAYGVAESRAAIMRDRGYTTRISLPYGPQLYSYLCAHSSVPVEG